MAKNSISDWDATASNNTDIGGISITGSSNVANFDNAFREIMAQIKTDLGNVDNTSDADKPINAAVQAALDGKSGTGHSHVLSDITDYVEPSIGSIWNWIINGDFSVNQRSAATKAQSAGVYGYDRWQGHASGLEQVVEDLPSGEYTLSWGGGGTGSIDGNTSAVSPVTETIVNGNISVIVPDTATDVCLMLGDTEGDFVARTPALELSLCMRYFEHMYFMRVSGYHTSTLRAALFFMVQKRTIPSVEIVYLRDAGGADKTSGASSGQTSVNGLTIQHNSMGTGSGAMGTFNIDAEL